MERVAPNFEENYGMWGMGEDAVEEDDDGEEDADRPDLDKLKREGKMTEKQLELYEKLVKRYEKLNNIKAENKRINVKEMDQEGGLTAGQQAQVARNDKAMADINSQIESLEETIYEMVEDSAAGGRKKKTKSGGRRVSNPDDIDSDDDEFYNRAGDTSKVKRAKNKAENIDTLTAKLRDLDDRRYGIEEKLAALTKDVKGAAEEVDALDAYMQDVQGQQVDEDKKKLQEQLWNLDAEEKELRMLLKEPTSLLTIKYLLADSLINPALRWRHQHSRG